MHGDFVYFLGFAHSHLFFIEFSLDIPKGKRGWVWYLFSKEDVENVFVR